jgi:Tfp pilus assembly protein PilN
MINLLPPPVKEQIAFAKLNAVIIRYVQLAVVLIIIFGGAFIGMNMYLSQRVAKSDQEFAGKQSRISTYKDLEATAKTINAQLTAIKSLQDNQPKFSTLLADLAAAMPRGTQITSLTLTGDDKKPVQINATADSYATATGLREALASSPRIAQVDLNSVSQATDGYAVVLTFTFKPGKAK